MSMKKNKITAILVDDEPKAIINLSFLIKEYDLPVEIVGTANDVDEAKILIEKHQPDVVFLDIEMPEKNGFVLFKEVEVNFNTIFVTAYNDFAIKAFEVSALDYLLKPIDINRLKEAIEKACIQKENQALKMEVLQKNLQENKIEHIVLPFRDSKVVVKADEIICIEAERSYSFVHIEVEGEYSKITFSRNLSYMEKLLEDHTQFFRSHRSWIINLNKVTNYKKYKNVVFLEEDVQAALSRNSIKEFEKKMKERD